MTKNDTNIPKGVKGWSWGAFFLSWIWALGNRVWIGLLAIIPVVNIVMAVILGIKGREWAWKTNRWSTLDEFNKSQRNWSLAGWIIFSLLIVSGILIPNYGTYYATKNKKVHYYSYKDGYTYGYERAVSKNEENKGQLSSPLILTNLLEDNSGHYKLKFFTQPHATSYTIYTCSGSCNFAESKVFIDNQNVANRIVPVKPRTILWEAIQDAENGKISVYESPISSKVLDKSLPNLLEKQYFVDAIKNISNKSELKEIKDYYVSSKFKTEPGGYSVGFACMANECGEYNVTIIFSGNDAWIKQVTSGKTVWYGSPTPAVRVAISDYNS